MKSAILLAMFVFSSGSAVSDCECKATVDLNSGNHAYLCQPSGLVGVQVQFRDPEAGDGDCTPPAACAAESDCSLTFPDDVSISISNCITTLYLEVPGYNQGARFLFSSDSNSFNLDIADCKCRSASASEPKETCEKEIKFFNTIDESNPFWTWNVKLECAKCAEVQ